MKKNGFTLAELMGVIVIISIIAVVVTLTIDRSIKNSRYTTCVTQEKNLIEGAKVWSIDNPQSLPTISKPTVSVAVSTLESEGYVEDNLENPMTEKPYNQGNVSVKIFVSTGTGATGKDFQYEVVYPTASDACRK